MQKPGVMVPGDVEVNDSELNEIGVKPIGSIYFDNGETNLTQDEQDRNTAVYYMAPDLETAKQAAQIIKKQDPFASIQILDELPDKMDFDQSVQNKNRLGLNINLDGIDSDLSAGKKYGL